MSQSVWYSYDDHNDTHGDGIITIYDVVEHTGRSQRSDTLTLTTSHGTSATLTIQQSAAHAFIKITGIEDESGNSVSTLSANAFVKYNIVGASNCPLLDVADQSSVVGTTLNDGSEMPHSTGFVLVEHDGLGSEHGDVGLNVNISPDYGSEECYLFRIPFLTNRNSGSSSRTITISVYNASAGIAATYEIQQNGDAMAEGGRDV